MTIDPTLRGLKLGPFKLKYDWKNAALYAIGLSAGTSDLKYLLDDPPAQLLPTYSVVPAFPAVFELLGKTGGNLLTLLHTAQRTELLSPFPPSGEMETTAELRGIWDMKVGALVIIDTETSVGGTLIARTNWQLLLRGEGGFGGERPPSLLRTRPKAGTQPLFRTEVPTMDNQALLYRLNGDINPIHSHPEIALKAGFDKPILHGLCFYGIAGRIALKELAGDDPSRFSSFEARFAKTVMPGDTLIIEGWPLETPNKVAITVSVKDSGDKAIANGLFEYE